MTKNNLGIGHMSKQTVIIDAYIINEINEEKRRTLDERTSAHLPCPQYEMELEEDYSDSNVDDDTEETVIIIDL